MSEIRFLSTVESELSSDTHWLGEEERAIFDRLRFEKRRKDWLLGRWAAKHAIVKTLGLALPLDRIAIRAAASGAPEAWIDARRLERPLSLSHSSGRAIAAIGSEGMRLGCDLERIEPRDPSFTETFFTRAERARIAAIDKRAQDRFVTTIWSAKESALKALGEGLRRDTRDLEIGVPDDLGTVWAPLTIRLANQVLHGWTSIDQGFVITAVSDPKAPIPEWIRGPGR